MLMTLPEKIGSYCIVALLGQGGMGAVYRAFKPPLTERMVAVKTIRADLLSNPTSLERFRLEAELVAKLNHPNILKVFDYEELPDGICFLVTEEIKGGTTLRDWIQKGRLTLEETDRVLEQLASALDYAYETYRVVHRDIKPSNIFIEDQRVVLGDFGIAKVVEGANPQANSNAVRLTETGLTLGTIDYMSPEQVKGEAIDRRSDVYSMGVLLFQMLAGELPFQGTTPFSIIMAHVETPPPSITSKNPKIPVAIENIINQALAKNKEERFSSAGQLAQSFHQALHQLEPISWPVKQLVSAPTKFAIPIKIATDEVKANSAPIKPGNSINSNNPNNPPLFLDGANPAKDVLTALPSAQPLNASLSAVAPKSEQRGPSKSKLGLIIGGLTGLILLGLGVFLLLPKGQSQPRIVTNPRAANPASVVTQNSLEAAANLDATGKTLLNAGRNQEALDKFKAATDLVSTVGNYQDDLAKAYEVLQNHSQAEQAARKAVNLEPQNGAFHYTLGIILKNENKLAEAASEVQTATKFDSRNAAYCLKLAEVQFQLKNMKEAASAARTVTTLTTDSSQAWFILGAAQSEQGELENAVASLNRAIGLDQKQANYWLMLAATYAKLKDPEKAQSAFRHAQALDPTVKLPRDGVFGSSVNR